MRIGHISDLHICRTNKKKNIKHFKTLLTHITNQKYDHLVITGDLSHNAEPKDFQLIREIFQDYGLLDSAKLSLTIGNHDIFGGVHHAEDIVSFPNKCVSLDYNKKVDQFGKYFFEAFENIFQPDGKTFPYAKDLGETVIIGVNSIDEYSKLKNPFASNGRVSKTELSGLKEIFQMDEFREKNKIVLIHHHFNKMFNENQSRTLWQRIESQTMKLRGKKKLIKLFQENKVAAVLHGHVHIISDYQRNNVRFLNAGASIEAGDPNSLQFNEININKSIMEVTSHFIPKYKSIIYPIKSYAEEEMNLSYQLS